MQYFREIFEELGNRVKSPILGSVFLVFLAINWRVLFVLFFSEQPVEYKLAYFDNNTSPYSLLVLPLVLGVVLGILGPWISLFGSWSASIPIQRQRLMADRMASLRLFEKAKLAKAREMELAVSEQSLIDRAMRDQEVEEIADENAREKVRDEIKKMREESNERASEVNALKAELEAAKSRLLSAEQKNMKLEASMLKNQVPNKIRR